MDLFVVVDLWDTWKTKDTVLEDFFITGKEYSVFINKVLEIERKKGNFILHNYSFGNDISKNIKVAESDYVIKAKDQTGSMSSLMEMNEGFLVDKIQDNSLYIRGKKIKNIYCIGQAFGICIHGQYCFFNKILKERNVDVDISIIFNLCLILDYDQISKNTLPIGWRKEDRLTKEEYSYSIWSYKNIFKSNFKI